MTQTSPVSGGPLQGERLTSFLNCTTLARLAGVKPDGRPYVIPLWYEWDGASLWFVGRKRAAWCLYVQQNPFVAVDIDVEGPLQAGDGQTFLTPKVIVEGRAEIVEPPGAGRQWVDHARAMAQRYRGERGLRYIEQTKDEQRWLIQVTPDQISSWEGEGWAKRYSEDPEARRAQPTS
jgi:nitroimidazol reductase NimA-like FMN-containing flavoprotein (pyridoxamine 5'-phosphate oxidase superfamily)